VLTIKRGDVLEQLERTRILKTFAASRWTAGASKDRAIDLVFSREAEFE
jgi:hypothetical protein